MPPRRSRSRRQKRPSSQALEAIVAVPPRRPRRGGSSASVNGAPPASGTGNEAVEVPVTSGSGGNTNNPAFPPELLDQLVARVTTEVKKQLQPSPAPPSQGDAIILLPRPTGELVSQPGQLRDALEVPIVQDGIRSLQSSLAGEQGDRPSVVFTSVNLPVDARFIEFRMHSSCSGPGIFTSFD